MKKSLNALVKDIIKVKKKKDKRDFRSIKSSKDLLLKKN